MGGLINNKNQETQNKNNLPPQKKINRNQSKKMPMRKKQSKNPQIKPKRKRKGMLQFRYICPETLDIRNHRGIQTQLSLKEMTLIHINAAESFHQKQQKSTVMTKITFLICTTVYFHKVAVKPFIFICSFALSRKNQEDCLQFSLILDKCSPDGCGLKGRAAFLPEEEENC